MTVRLSTGLRNMLCGRQGFSSIFTQGEIRIYSGTQPVSADAAATGALLGVVGEGGWQRQLGARASQTLTLAGTDGVVMDVKVGDVSVMQVKPYDLSGLVQFDTDLATTAALVALAINRTGICTASSSGAVVTVFAPACVGDAWNGLALSADTGGLTATSGGNMGGGLHWNQGLLFAESASGSVTKLVSQEWKFNGSAGGTAGWFRLVGWADDPGQASTTLARLDGSIGATGDMTLANNTISQGAPNTIDAFSFTFPAQ